MVTAMPTPEELLRRFQAGDESALGRLWAAYLPRLHRWTRRRFPVGISGGMTAEDLVQDAFLKSLPVLRTFAPRASGTLFGYFCAIVLNQIRDHARRSARRPSAPASELDTLPDATASPLEQVLSRERWEGYEQGLARLSLCDRQIVEAVVDERATDDELARRFGKPSRNAAGVARRRAVARLARAVASL
jgi:RNA polymerase sigma factor (sigma-70 family)